jgi:Zn-dependent protease
MLFSLHEILDIIIMTLIIGFIFKNIFHYTPKVEVFTPEHYLKPGKSFKRFKWTDFWFAAAVVAPSIILHEFGHKFVAMAFGLTATFHSPISIQHILNPSLIFSDFFALLTVIVILSRLFGWGNFIIFVPAFTVISAGGSVLQNTLISFAGPALNLVIWLAVMLILKTHNKMKNSTYQFLFLVKRINMFLFIFNMIPIPGFDGWSFWGGLVKMFF